MSVIEIKNLTKDYGHNRGVFDVSIDVEKGEVYGFLGPNGAGKTTTIRHIMGFSKAEKGTVKVNDLDCFKHANEIQKSLGYLPGEVNLPERLTGDEFIELMAKLRGIEDFKHTKYLTEKFQLDPSGSLKRMSIGSKRKLAIVTAFMHDPDVLVLDEPTSGLDPIMQERFIEFIKEEKERGKTIILSSHIFAEIDATCDRISIIKDGRIVSSFIADDLRYNEDKTFEIEFLSVEEFERFINTSFNSVVVNILEADNAKKQVKIKTNDKNINEFMKIISSYELKFLSEIKFTLEDYFMNFYSRNESHKEV